MPPQAWPTRVHHCRSGLKKPVRDRSRRSLRRARSTSKGRSSLAHIMGVVVRETSMDTSTAVVSTTENSRNSRPTMPPMNKMGVNTATREMEMDITVKPTSRAPRRAARNGLSPISRRRTIFSSTTMASSTTKPVDTVSAMSERLSRL